MTTLNTKSKKKCLSTAAVVFGAFMAINVHAADPAYNATKDQADANYDAAKARCDALSGNDKDVCIKEAKAAKTAAKADATTGHKSIEAKKDAQEDKMEAQYKAAKEKCDYLKGNEKDACQERAKAAYKP
jgi:hypothetical protein